MTKEIVFIEKKSVSCCGAENLYDHPLVYLEIKSDNKVTCPYCDKEFIFKQL